MIIIIVLKASASRAYLIFLLNLVHIALDQVSSLAPRVDILNKYMSYKNNDMNRAKADVGSTTSHDCVAACMWTTSVMTGLLRYHGHVNLVQSTCELYCRWIPAFVGYRRQGVVLSSCTDHREYVLIAN